MYQLFKFCCFIIDGTDILMLYISKCVAELLCRLDCPYSAMDVWYRIYNSDVWYVFGLFLRCICHY